MHLNLHLTNLNSQKYLINIKYKFICLKTVVDKIISYYEAPLIYSELKTQSK